MGYEGLKSVLDAMESEQDDGSSSLVRWMDVRARANLLTAEGATALFDRLSAWGYGEAARYHCVDDENATLTTVGNETNGEDLGVIDNGNDGDDVATFRFEVDDDMRKRE